MTLMTHLDFSQDFLFILADVRYANRGTKRRKNAVSDAKIYYYIMYSCGDHIDVVNNSMSINGNNL